MCSECHLLRQALTPPPPPCRALDGVKLQPNPIFNLTARYKADKDPNALNLGVGGTPPPRPGLPQCLPPLSRFLRLSLAR